MMTPAKLKNGYFNMKHRIRLFLSMAFVWIFLSALLTFLVMFLYIVATQGMIFTFAVIYLVGLIFFLGHCFGDAHSYTVPKKKKKTSFNSRKVK